MSKHRADFVDYLLDALRLRRDPERMASVWTHIMVEIVGLEAVEQGRLTAILSWRHPTSLASEGVRAVQPAHVSP